jgi:hypothetical protein
LLPIWYVVPEKGGGGEVGVRGGVGGRLKREKHR